MQTVPVDLCYSEPSSYRLCGKNTCIPWRQKCPCKELSEFQCSLGNCIPLHLKCDGLKQCLYGDDEENCYIENKTQEKKVIPSLSGVPSTLPATDMLTGAMTEGYNKVKSATEQGLSAPLIVIIASVCVFICVLMVFLLYIFLTRRQKNNTSRDSQSATQPLRKSCIISETDNFNGTSPTKTFYNEKSYTSRKPMKSDYFQVNIQNEDNEAENQVNNHMIDNNDESKHQTEKECNKSSRQNLAINPGAEIYTMDHSHESEVNGLGKYTFKPRLKYLKSKPYDEIEEKDRDKLYVINSYKHCSGKSIIPETLTFVKDPKKFSDTFATDLLCSSTPRQSVKHTVQNKKINSLESITSNRDLDIT